MKITEASIDDILGAYDDPNLQQAAVEFVGHLKSFDRTEDDDFIFKMEDVARRIRDHIPYDEVHFMGSWTTEPSFVMMTTILKMSRLGFLPSIDRKEI